MTYKVFEQKLYAHFQDSLKLFFPKDILRKCETPLELIEYVSKVKDTLRLQETFRGKVSDRNEWHLLNNPNVSRRSLPAYRYLYNFIMNRVPSDLYRVKNPKLDVTSNAARKGAPLDQPVNPLIMEGITEDPQEDQEEELNEEE